MALFNNMLGSGESLFKNEFALDFSFMPKIMLFRETQQRQVAAAIAPLFQNRNGRNIIIYGKPGIGKTLACKKVTEEVEEKTDDIIPIYVNCWQKNTSYKIVLELCERINYKFTHNKKTDELFEVVKRMLAKKAVVFIFY